MEKGAQASPRPQSADAKLAQPDATVAPPPAGEPASLLPQPTKRGAASAKAPSAAATRIESRMVCLLPERVVESEV